MATKAEDQQAIQRQGSFQAQGLAEGTWSGWVRVLPAAVTTYGERLQLKIASRDRESRQRCAVHAGMVLSSHRNGSCA